jgi:hypothetical protein
MITTKLVPFDAQLTDFHDSLPFDPFFARRKRRARGLKKKK